MKVCKPRDIERAEFPQWDPESPDKWAQEFHSRLAELDKIGEKPKT